MIPGVGNEIGSAPQVPLAPGRNDLDVRLEGVRGQLEPDLVVSRSRGAKGDGLGGAGAGPPGQAPGG
jgi:hypothetical protein